ncbi:putative aldehyde reductase [Mollisia scopiformis]|uniref:Putative aldehyde reductase n=1 Tax=Mollisia scopiformis TaxID=149040 RepID=A0A132B6R8_MOLSC|nr:putative aldehyde reductase [Mollisia scopiformis]KUJ08031.1 putative aldehyde reductase [Mollisia scopiformis]
MSKPIPLIFGAASIMTGGAYYDSTSINNLFDVLEETGITTIDAAQLYGDYEVLLGTTNVSKRNFIIDSKSPGGWVPGSLDPAKLREGAYSTLRTLGIKKLSTFYIHGSDPAYPPETWLPTVNELHKEGVFSTFGLLNFTTEEVESIHVQCLKNDWILPTVYQGNFSAFARHMQKALLPILRKLNISFSAYSALAGGFLARTSGSELSAAETGGRFAVDPEDPEGKKGGLGLYRQLYSERPVLVKALEKWGEIAKVASCICPAELAYRWVCWNGGLSAEKGDMVTVGASKPEQLRKTKEWVQKGLLNDAVCAMIDDLWDTIQDAAPLDNLHM